MLTAILLVASCGPSETTLPYPSGEKKDGVAERGGEGKIPLVNHVIQGPQINGHAETPTEIELHDDYPAPEVTGAVDGAPEGSPDCSIEIRMYQNNTGCASVPMTVRINNGVSVTDHVITLSNTDWHSVPITTNNGNGVNIFFDIPNSCGGSLKFDVGTSHAKWQLDFFIYTIQASSSFALGLWNHHWPKSPDLSLADNFYICDPWCSWTVRAHNTTAHPEGLTGVFYNLRPLDDVNTGYANFWIDFGDADDGESFTLDPIAPNVTYKIQTEAHWDDIAVHTDFWVYQAVGGPQAAFFKDVPPTSFTGPIPSNSNCDPVMRLCTELEPLIGPCYSPGLSCIARRGKFGLNVCEPENMTLATWASKLGFTIQSVTWSISGNAAWNCSCNQFGSVTGSSISPWITACNSGSMTITATATLLDPAGNPVTTTATLLYPIPSCYQ